jgi:Extracellular link domain/Collagen triple helix repeat (20 copies)
MSTGATGPSGSNSSSSTQNASSATGGTGRTGPTGNIKESILTSDVYGVFVGAFFIVLSLVVLFVTNSFIAVLVLWATIALVLAVLVYYDFVSIDQLFGSEIVEEKEKKKEVVPATPGTPAKPKLGGPIVGSEVFHIYDQVFTYDEAPAVCGAYGGELATLEQIMEAYSKGAEWCGYGWSVGGMALYPTQLETWKRLQQEVDPGKRTFCGRPGVNGGYFDPATKFGVNCFGFKPAGQFTPPGPVPGVDMTKYNSMVERFKRMLKTLTLDPYSRNEWSKYKKQSSVEKFVGGSSFTNPFKQSFFTPFGVREHLEGGDEYVESLNGSLGNNARSFDGPYGIRGGKGETGPTGEKGDQGNPGQPGSEGATGPSGERGYQGYTGADGREGPEGKQGPEGPAGNDGDVSTVVGAQGPTGSTGKDGIQGPTGNDGKNGKDGKDGAEGKRGNDGAEGKKGEPGPATQATIPRNLNVDSIDIGGVRIDQRGGQPGTLQFSRPGHGTDAGFLFDMDGHGPDWSTMFIRRGDYKARQ